MLHMFRQLLFWAGNGPEQSSNFQHILATQETLTDFDWDEAKIPKKENSKIADSKKLSFLIPPTPNIFFFQKFQELVLV